MARKRRSPTLASASGDDLSGHSPFGRVAEFEALISDLHTVGKNGVAVRIVEGVGGRLKVHIEVGEDARHQDVRDIVPTACAVRDRLLELQGAVWPMLLDDGPDLYLEGLLERARGGTRMPTLARQVNGEIEKLLSDYVEAERLGPRADPLKLFGWQRAATMLYALGVDRDEDIEELIAKAVGRLNNGEPAFADTDFPVDAIRLTATLKKGWANSPKRRRYKDLKTEKS